MQTETFDAAIIGAGAAGLFCALTAARRGRRVLLLDHAAAPGAKILISGGGRCNFTNRHVAARNFLSHNPQFCQSALAGYPPEDFIAMVGAHNIAFHEKRLGQLFCDGPARQILDMLLRGCAEAGVDLRLGQKISGMSKDGVFTIETGHGNFAAGAVVLATGGLSIPKLGASGFAHEAAQKFGLKLTDIRPGLVPLVFGGETSAWMQGLAGVSCDSTASCGKTSFREASLFTHRGLSGPAILQISSYWRAGEPVILNLLPGQDAYKFLLERKAARPKAELKTVLGEILPARLAHNLLQPPLRNGTIGELPNQVLKTTAGLVNALPLTPAGTEGYGKAEVTAGGIDTAGLSSKTMEALEVPGLYAIGEALDVTGWLGGYNFQWAWASGHAAGCAIARGAGGAAAPQK